MSIAPFAAGSYVNDRTTTALLGLKTQLGTLTSQLVTGRTAETYGGLGAGRITSLSAHATVSTLDGYITAASNAKTRVDLTTTSLSQIKTTADTTRTRLLTTLQSTTPVGIANSVSLARSSFDAAVDALNQQVAGQYIFSGRTTDTQPVVSSNLIFDGDIGNGLDGLKTLIREQAAADFGTDKNGRLTQTRTGATVSLTEDASAQARANFGFQLVGVTSSNTNGVTATSPSPVAQGGEPNFATQPADGAKVRVAVLLENGGQRVVDLTARGNAAPASVDGFAIGADAAEAAANLKTQLQAVFGPNAKIASIQSTTPPGASLDFTASAGPGASLSLEVKAPVAGDTIAVKLGMRDGTTTTIMLKASSDTTGAGTFRIDTTGATAAERAENTAANLNQALDLALKQAANTELAASSTQRAAENFFAGSGSPGLEPRRINAAGSGYVEQPAGKTVIWYRGDDTASDPRSTATVRVGIGQDVGIGAQANEQPIRATLASLASLAAGTFTNAAGTQDVARFSAAATRTANALLPSSETASVADLATAFGLASGSMSNAKTQAQATKTLVETSVDSIENVSVEEVAAKLLNLQTQLQASYQVTSMISKLTLANFLN